MADAKDRLTALVSVHDVAKEMGLRVLRVKRWHYQGLPVPMGRIAELRKQGWKIVNRRARLWCRRVGNDLRTTWEELEKFLEATGSQP